MSDVATTRRWPDLRITALPAVRAFIRQRGRADGASDEAIDDLVQATDELVCNVIRHGYRAGSGPVELTLEREGDRLRITIADQAPPVDPTRHPEPRLDLPLEQRPLGGMGVHLARSLTDTMRHRMLPEGGNEVTFEKRL